MTMNFSDGLTQTFSMKSNVTEGKSCKSSFRRFMYLFGCSGSSLLRMGFLWFHSAGTTPRCGEWAGHRSGFSCCRAQALGALER